MKTIRFLSRKSRRALVCAALALILCLGAFPAPARAAARTFSLEHALAADMKSLGLFAGVSETDFALERAPTRVEALVMLIRLMGIEAQVTAGAWKHPFRDVPGWADKYIGYAYSTGLTSGESSDRFGTGNASAAVYLTFVLRALGYTDRGEAAEFRWDDPFTLARSVGILTEPVDLANFLRADMVTVSYAALAVPQKGTDRTLAQALMGAGVFTAEQYAAFYSPGYLTGSSAPCARAQAPSRASQSRSRWCSREA